MSAVEQAEYVCGCRSCGNHCMVVERDRAVQVGGEVLYSDGFLGGWRGVQTEVVTCPHCGIVISWRKNCMPAEVLRKAGDLNRFYLPIAAWGPPPLYWAGFDQYDGEFHPAAKAGKKPAGALPRLAKAPEAAQQWSLRKRGWLARGLLWLDNDRERSEFTFGAQRPSGKRAGDDEFKRARLLRALVEAAQYGGEESDANALDLAEWHRELGEWDAALKALDRTFDDLVLADRAQQLEELVAARNAKVVALRPPPQLEAPAAMAAPAASPAPVVSPAPIKAAPAPAPAKAANPPKPAAPAAPFAMDFAPTQSAPAAGAALDFAPTESAPRGLDFAPTQPHAPAPPAAEPDPVEPAAEAATPAPEPETEGAGGDFERKPGAGQRSPRALLGVLLEVLGSMPAEILTRDHIPRPYGALLRTLRKSNQWDEDSFAVAVISGFAKAHGWPDDADPESLQLLRELVVVDEELLTYLAEGFKRASWQEWAFDVPAMPAPKGH